MPQLNMEFKPGRPAEYAMHPNTKQVHMYIRPKEDWYEVNAWATKELNTPMEMT